MGLQVRGRLRLQDHPHLTGDAVVDLAGLTFVDPFGLVAIGLACMSAGTGLQFVAPLDIDVCNYLSRMGLEELIGRHCDQGGHLPTVRHKDLRDRLLELRVVSGHTMDDIANLLWERIDSAGAIDSGVRQAMHEGIWELANNVFEHSGTTGLAAAQAYMIGTGAEHLVLAVGDAGKGIRRSLAEGGLETADDGEAIVRALERHVSGTGKRGRGVGLTDLVEQTRGVTGQVVIRSGTGRVQVWRHDLQKASVSCWPGTMVGVKVPCRPGGRR